MSFQDPIESPWWRRFYAAWVVYLAFLVLVHGSSEIMEHVRDDAPWSLRYIAINELTSKLMIGALLPLVVWFDTRFPFRRDSWQWILPLHALATLPFAALHTTLMFGSRWLVFSALGEPYEPGELGFEFVYEYRKIATAYVLIVASLQGFRHYVALRRLLEMPEAEAAAEPARDAASPTQRFLARRDHREVVVAAIDIRYVESAGNYVVLHTPQGELRLRETLEGMERRLDPSRFARVHRTTIVNLDAVREIQPWFHGDQRIVLTDGTLLNLSRRYRDRLAERIAG